jgi:phosphoribosylformylglycinamidine synthase PurS subunit
VRFRAQVVVSLNDGLLDPQGKAVEGSLPALGWTNVSDVRVGRYVELDVEAIDQDAAVSQVQAMAERLLSNPVIETFRIVEVSELVGLGSEDRS